MAEPPVITLKEGKLAFGGKTLFNGLELIVHRGDRACLVGRNGSGKSTMMNVVTGRIEFDSGDLYIEPGLRIHRLEQDPAVDPDQTVRDFVMAGGTGDGHPDHEIDSWLSQVALDGSRDMRHLSGGEHRRAAIARAFAGEPDVLLLDEPTNHLDLSAIQWLENEIRVFRGAILTVSHDRTFLENITAGPGGRTLWLDRGRLRVNAHGFAGFDAWQEEVLEVEQKTLERLNSRIADESRWLLRGVTARRKRNQGRLRKLDTMRASRAAIIADRPQDMKLEAEEGSIKSRLVVDAKNVSKSFRKQDGSELVIVEDFSTRILRGDRIGIIGPNGAGKTTLLSILGDIRKPDGGTVRQQGPNADRRIGWVPQQTAVYSKLTVAQNLRLFARLEGVADIEATVVRMLEQTALTDRANDELGSLSGGNRQRVNIAVGLLADPPVLLLDEPSGALDPRQRQRLWGFITGLTDRGTSVVFATHDISEAERHADRVLVLADGDLLFNGTPAQLHADSGAARGEDMEQAFVAFLRAQGH